MLEDDTRKVFEGLRRLSHDLHPATLRLLGLAAALRTHCAEVSKYHSVEVAFTADASRARSTRRSRSASSRIAQEALRNGIVHGGARHLSVSLSGSSQDLELVVTDDGTGFDVPSVYLTGGRAGLVDDERTGARGRRKRSTSPAGRHRARGSGFAARPDSRAWVGLPGGSGRRRIRTSPCGLWIRCRQRTHQMTWRLLDE
jgi:signal transduction histidine kinase